MTVLLEASGCREAVPFTTRVSADWASARPRSGTIASGTPVAIEVRVDRSRLAPGINVTHMVIESGTTKLDVTVEVIRAT